ncbi:hypothetical protein HYS00_02730 [Candidatus Microgenomates bacterium]|nr:hypothetical protein [Candidatus Microgenomates bacterium]
MKKLFVFGLFLFVCFVYAPVLLGQAHAASLKFDKTTNSVTNGSTFDVQVVIDPGSEQVTSTDAWILYDKNVFTVVAVKDGTYFPIVINDTNTAGKIYIAGLVNDPTEFKSGVGTVATITLKANANGSSNLAYECNLNQTETSKIIKNDINSTNIIDCGSNGQQAITVGSSGGGGGGTTTTPTSVPGVPTATSAPTMTPTITLTPSPTQILPSPTIASISATPSALPQSGVIENLVNIALPGILLVTIGGVLKVLLHI